MFKILAKKAAAWPGLYHLNRHLSRYRPAILMYHGLTDDPNVHDWTQVNITDFKAQMRYLQKHYRPVSMKDMIDMLDSGNVEPHAIAVTFDDGYKSNYALAYPILRELNIPATVYITSGFVLQNNKYNRYLWPDFITALLKSNRVANFDLDRFGLGQYDLTSDRNIFRARDKICEILKSAASTRKNEIVAALNDRFGESLDPGHFLDYCPMSIDDVRQLSNDGLVTIGAHSRTHPILSQLDADDLYDEIAGSKKDLEEIIDSEIGEFAYPNGRWRDINSRVVDITACHFNCAVMTEAGLNRSGGNKYLLRRIGIGRNLGLNHFRAMLSGAFYWGRKRVHCLQDAGK